MKKLNTLGMKLFILMTISTLFLASQFKSPSANERGQDNSSLTPVPDSQFIISAFDNAKDLTYHFKDSLRFNTWHKYTGPRDYGWPGVNDDNYDGNIGTYGQGVSSRINDNRNIYKARYKYKQKYEHEFKQYLYRTNHKNILRENKECNKG